jgi:ATP-dependent protease HslVU (ClpYQ) peptidase subunit
MVSTFAGSGIAGATDGSGIGASFNYPRGVTVDASGNIYIADNGNNKIRKITSSGVVSTLAGNGNIGAADGNGTTASFSTPDAVAVDASGNVYVADEVNNKIRKITPSGVVSTLAGSGTTASTDGIGIAASFNHPGGIAIDVSGNVYVTEFITNKIRKISQAGVVATLAGSGANGSADGIGSVASFSSPVGVTVDDLGNVYVADDGNNKIRKITQGGYTISPNLPTGLSFDSGTGIISGTPTVATPTTNYTVTAYNSAGSNTTTVVIATATLGTNSFEKNSMEIYPNPTKNQINLQFPNQIKADKIVISDLTGKVILTQTSFPNQVDISQIANGMYIIQAFSGKEKFTSKFIKE